MTATAPIGSPDAVQPESLWFGRDGAATFGMLHRPRQQSTRGVIFCNALGFEGLLAHRALRRIADDVTERGFWSLRFDYDGEGDSHGGAWDPGRVDAWLESIDAAVDVLRARGVTDVRLVGFRMGATLASLYALSRPGVSSLVLWSPCAKGKTYARELHALSRLSALARPPQHVAADWYPEGAMEVAAFDVSGETLRDIGKINLLETPIAACPPAVFVIDRDDAPGNDALVQKLTDAGARVDHERMPGYEDFMTDSDQSSVLPVPILHRIAQWIGDTTAAPTDDVRIGEPPVETDTLAIEDPTAGLLAVDGPIPHQVIERAVWIDGRFFAVIASPADDGPNRNTSIVLCNTGSLNRTGPGRLHVNLARYWAGLGFTVVRVDLGGCGDTLAPDAAPDSVLPVLAPARAEELSTVVQWVRRWTGTDHVVAGGLCSGAYNAFHVALNGEHLDDVILVNPGTFYVSENDGEMSVEETLASAHFLTKGFVNWPKWKLALRDAEVRRQGFKNVQRLLGKKALSGIRVLAVESARNRAHKLGLPVKATSMLSRDLEAIIGRGGKVFIAFSAAESAEVYFRTVGGPACQELARAGAIDLTYIDGGDHVFASSGARHDLILRMTTYLDREHPEVADGAAVAARPETRRVSGSRGPLGLSAL